MNIKSIIIYLFVSLGIVTSYHSQTFSCTDLYITNIFPDSTNASNYEFSVQFNAGPNIFINYPFVSTVLDCNGDTVATGNIFYFGQFGQTLQNYPVTLTGNGDITCHPLTATFIINNDFGIPDTCQLSYESTGISSFENRKGMSIYPNPVQKIINIETPQNQMSESYLITDGSGKLIMKGNLTEEITNIDLSILPKGLYLIKIGDDLTNTFKFIKE